jgi:beta-aspartyl-dipeptidase (metallo-type)
MWSGSYEIPSKTLTKGIKRDLMLIDKVIGAKGCISDHRSSQPTLNEISKMISDCRVGGEHYFHLLKGLTSGKAGKAYFHLGNDKERLDLLFKIIETTAIPIQSIYLTHIERNQYLIDEGVKWVKKGGYIDFTCDSDPNKDQETTRALLYLDKISLPSWKYVTISSG